MSRDVTRQMKEIKKPKKKRRNMQNNLDVMFTNYKVL